METKTPSGAAFLAALLVACGTAVEPAADAQRDGAVRDEAAPDAAPLPVDAPSVDASPVDARDESAPDATPGPDVLAPDDARAFDPGPDVHAVASAPEFCGVALVAGATDGRSGFTIAWAENRSARESAVHVAHVGDRGVLSNDHIVAQGAGSMCVTRGSLSDDGSLVVWSHTADSFSTIEGAVLDASANRTATLRVPSSRSLSAPLTPSNLLVTRSGNEVTLAFETLVGPESAVRAIRFDLAASAAPTPGAVPEARVVREYLLPLGVPTADSDVLLADGLVVYTRRADPSAPTLYARDFYVGGTNGDEFAIPFFGASPAPVALRGRYGSFELLFDAGTRDRSLYRLPLQRPWPGGNRPLLVAADTAWHATLADLTEGRPDVLWTSHGSGGGYNTEVLLAPEGYPEPHRCVAFRAGHERGSFVALAHAQRASRNRLIAAIESVPDGRATQQTLYLRGIADGGTVCE